MPSLDPAFANMPTRMYGVIAVVALALTATEAVAPVAVGETLGEPPSSWGSERRVNNAYKKGRSSRVTSAICERNVRSREGQHCIPCTVLVPVVMTEGALPNPALQVQGYRCAAGLGLATEYSCSYRPIRTRDTDRRS